MTISIVDLEQGLNLLDVISVSEYEKSLLEVIQSPDEHLAFKRIGRLMCVWLKQPFAESGPYDPDPPSNWAKSIRCWEIHEPANPAALQRSRHQAELLVLFAMEWERPIEFMAEFNIFHSICKRLRPVICGKSEVLERAEKVAAELKKQGNDVQLSTLNQVLGAASLSLATYLVQNLSWLSSEHLPIVVGCTVLATSFGQNKLCKFLTDFESAYDERKDVLAKCLFPQCGSSDTNNGKPCSNRVRIAGQLCWIHAGRR